MKVKILLFLALSANLTACGGGSSGNSAPPTGIPEISSSSAFSSTSSAPVVIKAPIKVEQTSYLNKVKFGDPNHGKTYHMVGIKGRDTRPIAYGDFLQDGSTTALAIDYLDTYSKFAADWVAPRIYFFKQVGSNWLDVTDRLLVDTTGCKGLKKGSVADFNNDGKPDLFLGCTGADTADNTVGEPVRILLSQPNGTYSNTVLPLTCYCHASTAGDINGDGNIDIITYNNLNTAKTNSGPIVLMGAGDGTFTKDLERFHYWLEWMPIFTLELVDVGRGMLDLLIGGNGAHPGTNPCQTCTFENSIMQNEGGGTFRDIYAIDNSLGKDDQFYALAVDFVIKDGFLYMAQVSENYNAIAIRKVDLQYLTLSTLVYEYVSPDQTGPDTWFPWITILDNGNIASVCDYSDLKSEWCNWTGI